MKIKESCICGAEFEISTGDEAFERRDIMTQHNEFLNAHKTCREQNDVKRKYYQLIVAVEQKYPGESRHDTALRYIKEREESSKIAKEDV